jgi:hypothetical protein
VTTISCTEHHACQVSPWRVAWRQYTHELSMLVSASTWDAVDILISNHVAINSAIVSPE